MTPPSGFLRRLFGGRPADPAESPVRPPGERAPGRTASRPTTDAGDPAADESQRRRRGRRGGRGRRKAEGAPPEATGSSAPTATHEPREPRARNGRTPDSEQASTDRRSGRKPPAAGAEAERDGNYRWGRRVEGEEARQRGEQASRRRRFARPQRENLDAPLPEDVAFRSGEEGGDRTILPARRRRPTGLRDTSRILVGGARTIGNWVPRGDVTPRNALAPVRPVEPPLDQPLRLVVDDDHDEDLAAADAVAAEADAEAGADESDESDEDATKRRRRGRRGGRGRRRPEDGGAAEAGLLDADGRGEDENADIDDGPAPVLAAPPLAGEVPAEETEATEERPARRRHTRGAPEAGPAEDEAREPATARPAERPRRQRAEAVDPGSFPAAFADLGATERTLVPLARFGFDTPTPIQEQAIPALMNGLDVVGIAQTGSGKTVAFGVPMVEKLDPELPEVQGIVLVPTRELAQQVLEVLGELAAYSGLEAVGLLGGHSLQRDFRALEGRPHIVVGTPGRILDHLGRGTLALRYVQYAVLDEADQMLDIGFLPDIRRILSRTPQRRQTALFSATMPGTIRRLIWQFMQDPETISVAAESTTVESTEQIYMEVASRDKVRAMRELIERELKGRTLIFCNMKRRVDNLEHDLARDGVRVGALHGDMDQKQRDRVVQQFREGALDVLIATNVAARGLDIPEITHVVNYDVPQNPDEYVHRIGRTGRAGREGKAITFVSEWDIEAFDAIHAKHGDRLRKEDLDLYRPSMPRSGESAS